MMAFSLTGFGVSAIAQPDYSEAPIQKPSERSADGLAREFPGRLRERRADRAVRVPFVGFHWFGSAVPPPLKFEDFRYILTASVRPRT